MTNRPCLLRTFLIGLLSVLTVQAVEKRNVLFIIADDLNCDLGCYGDRQVQSPNIDALARRGVRFEHAYCQYPVCNPSRTSFMTGRRPNVTKILDLPKGHRFSSDYTYDFYFRNTIPDTITLPELFRKNGYVSARVGKIYHYGVPGQIGTSGLDDRQSWDYLFNPAGRDKSEENKIFSLVPGYYGPNLSWLATEGTDAEQTDGLGATAAISLLEEYGASRQPFFLAVGFFRPHTPYVAPRKYFEMYPADQITLPELSEQDGCREPAAAYASLNSQEAAMSDTLRRQAIQGYRASISFMDAQVGRVVAALDRLGLAENTVIVFTSDHGYHTYEHGLWQKMSLFENSARVPLIVVAPEAKQGTTASTISEMVDIYPTIADLCGLTPPDYVAGLSLRPALANPQATVKTHAFTQLRRHEKDSYSVRTSQWRYTQWEGGAAGEQLYDMQADPGETKNLAADPGYASVVAELRRSLAEYPR